MSESAGFIEVMKRMKKVLCSTVECQEGNNHKKKSRRHLVFRATSTLDDQRSYHSGAGEDVKN